MEIKMRHIVCAGVMALLVVTALQIFSLGSGRGHALVLKESYARQDNTTPQPEHLSVIYEREWRGKSDLVHLQVDTTFHKIGKAGFEYETLCKRQYSLREFSQEYSSMDNSVWACFIKSDKEREWIVQDNTRRIIDYHCHEAVTKIGDRRFVAWYTVELPYCPDGARATDQMEGLILEVKSDEGDFSLKAKYIEQQIG